MPLSSPPTPKPTSGTKEEDNEYRKKTQSRLIDKRREDHGTQRSSIALDKKQKNQFREKYRADLKERIIEEVAAKVDKTIVKKALQRLKSQPEEVYFEHVTNGSSTERELVYFDNSLFRFPGANEEKGDREHSLMSLSNVPLNLVMQRSFYDNIHHQASPLAVESFNAAVKNKLMQSSSGDKDEDGPHSLAFKKNV